MIDRKVSLLPILFLFSFGWGYGQQLSTADNRLGLHISSTNLFDRTDKVFTMADDTDGTSNSAAFQSGYQLGISFTRIQPNQYYYRVGLIGLKIADKRVRDFDSVAYGEDSHQLTEITTQFEVGKYFGWRKVNVGTGLFVRPGYLGFEHQPESFLGFDLSIRNATVDAGVNGILSYAISEHLQVTAQLPIAVGRMQYTTTYADNPFLLEAERKSRDFRAIFDVNVGLQVGVAVRL